MGHPVDLMVNPIMIPMAQAAMVQEVDLHLAIEVNADAVRKGLLASHCWCETCLRT